VPGLVGLITRLPRASAEAQLRSMLKSICYESFYNVGMWIDESLGVYVGWTVLKGSFSDGMPLKSANGDVCMVFSGEEYSDDRVAYFSQNGHRSAGSSEAGYLIERSQEPNFIPNLNGMFHGLVANRARGVVTLFNDRYGMHRLCYHQTSDTFYFGCEAKAILAARPDLRTPDARSLGEFVSLSCVLENRTIFKGIQVLPAASAWEFRNAELSNKLTYFEAQQWENQAPLTSEAFYNELRSVVISALPKYFAGREQLGIAMTGGFDTRVILASHPPAPGSLPSYTFGGPFRESRDVTVGRKIASICQQPHQIIEVGNDFLTGFPKNAERTVAITEGTSDISRADLYLSQRVRQIAPAKIVGTYGSEILRRAVMFKPDEPPQGLFERELLAQVHEVASTFTRLRETQHPVTFAAFTQSPWYHQGILAMEQSQLTVRSPFLDNDFLRAVYRAPKDYDSLGDFRIRLIQDGSKALGRVRSDRGLGGNGNRLASALEHAYQEFTFKAEYAYDYGMPQSVARVDHVFSALRLERLFLGRHKLLHFRVWYRDQLSEYVRQMLLDSRTLSRPYLNKRAVETIVDGHLKRGLNYTMPIHKLITLELLHRLFFDA